MTAPHRTWTRLTCLALALLTPGEARPAGPPAHPPGIDRYGDRLPEGATTRLGTVRLREEGPLTGLAFSPDGRWLASAAPDGPAHFWDARARWGASGAPPGSWARGLRLGRNPVASPGGQLLAVADPDGVIKIESAATGRVLRRLKARGIVVALAFSPDCKRLASAAWAIGPGGSGSDNEFTVWDVTTGKELRRLPGTNQRDNTVRGELSVAFSPDGKLLASTGWDGTVRLWDPFRGKEVHRWVEKERAGVVAFSPSGRLLAWSGGWGVCLGDLATRRVRRLRGHAFWVTALAFSPDGRTLASGGYDRSILLWDVARGKALSSPAGHDGPVHRVACAPDGKTVATAGMDGTARLWEAATGKERWRLTGLGPLGSVAFTPDGRAVAVSDGKEVRLRDPATGRCLSPAGGGPFPGDFLAFSPDGKTLATACRGPGDTGRIDLWDWRGGKRLRTLAVPAPVWCASFSPDGKLLASGGRAKGVRLWAVSTGKQVGLLAGPDGLAADRLAFSPDGKLLAAATWENIRVWELGTRRERAKLGEGGYGYRSIAFSPDGKALASAAADETLRLWELAGGQQRREFRGHGGGVNAVAFGPGGRFLVSGGEDTTALVWDVWGARQRPMRLTPGRSEALWAALADPDAGRAFSALRILVGHPGEGVRLLGDHIRPVVAPDAAGIARLVFALDDDRFGVREKATAQLERAREVAAPHLRKLLEGRPSPEARKRARGLLRALEGPVPSPRRLREVRAVEALEHIGTAEARRVLAALAEGAPGARLTQEARAALRRLEGRTVAR